MILPSEVWIVTYDLVHLGPTSEAFVSLAGAKAAIRDTIKNDEWDEAPRLLDTLDRHHEHRFYLRLDIVDVGHIVLERSELHP